MSALPEPARPTGVPVVLGVNWYVEFDRPVLDGARWWIARDGQLSSVRGGHCVAARAQQSDSVRWWRLYDQGEEGACTGFGSARAKSLLDRREYDALELYHAGQSHGGYLGEDGAYVRDVLWVLVNRGAVRRGRSAPDESSRIAAYRWATSVDDVLATLASPTASRLGAVPLLNSWGLSYPHLTWLPGEVLQRLLDEDGEAAVVTDL